jgi:hypothetical protein
MIASMKQCYWADLRTLADEDNNTTGLWEKNDSVGCYSQYVASWAWSSMNLVTWLQLVRKVLPDLGNDLQSLPNEEISKSEILNMVCAVRTFENINKETSKNGCRVMCEVGFQHMIDRHCQCCHEDGEDENEICTAMRSLNNSQKEVIITNYFSKYHQLCKENVKQFVKFCECIKQNILDYPCFSIIRESSPFINPDNQEFTLYLCCFSCK